MSIDFSQFYSDDNIVPFGVAAVVLLAGFVANRFSARRNIDGPILSSTALLGASDLQSMARGQMAGFAYNMLTNDSGRVMFSVQLGRTTGMHIIAYGDKSRLPENLTGSLDTKFVEPVVLEGDFPEYFHMLCNPDAQAAVREVFAPDVMVHFIDFCRAYDFELFHEALYVSVAEGAVDTQDKTSLAADLETFLHENGDTLRRL